MNRKTGYIPPEAREEYETGLTEDWILNKIVDIFYLEGYDTIKAANVIYKAHKEEIEKLKEKLKS